MQKAAAATTGVIVGDSSGQQHSRCHSCRWGSQAGVWCVQQAAAAALGWLGQHNGQQHSLCPCCRWRSQSDVWCVQQARWVGLRQHNGQQHSRCPCRRWASLAAEAACRHMQQQAPGWGGYTVLVAKCSQHSSVSVVLQCWFRPLDKQHIGNQSCAEHSMQPVD